MKNIFICVFLSSLTLACSPELNEHTMNNKPSFDIQGHRGCRGLYPENTIPAFLHALELGVTTLEMDVVISKDRRVVVSHDPFLSHEICKTIDGQEISEQEEKQFNLYKMEYSEIQSCDCGSKNHPRFPDQIKMFAFKPLLEDVIDSAEDFAKKKKLPKVYYNIEIKSTPEGDDVYHPRPKEFVEQFLAVLKKKNVLHSTTIQSFDVRPLLYIHKEYPTLELSYLVENNDSPEENLNRLTFVPDIYSPDYTLVNKQLISFAKERKMKVIPWTVNDIKTINKLKHMGVDGIITDYPDLLKQ